MQVEILNVDVQNKGKYRVAAVSYKGRDGKVDAKNIMSFTYKDVFKTLSEAKTGDVFEVKSQKNDKGYWDWIEVTSAGKNTGGSTDVTGSSGRRTTSTFETPEERAKRQVYIVRQSSVSNAIEYFMVAKEKPTVEDVIKVAKQIEEYVFDVAPAVQEAEVT